MPYNDEDRTRLAKPNASGTRMLGPIERERCSKHRRRWVTFRWVWNTPENGDHLDAIESDSWPEIEHSCVLCAKGDD